MGLRDVIRAIREYPATHVELAAMQYELRQTQQALEHSEQECEGLRLQMGEQTHYTKYLSHRSAALQAALQEFCPRLSSVEEMKRFYDTISPSMDQKNFTLYHIAEKILGLEVSSAFPYEDNRGLFEEMDGHQLLDWLTAVHFQAVEWEIIPDSTYEYGTLQEVDTSTPEYQDFERQLYKEVLERMGFQDIIALEQEVSAIEDKTTELKLYSPLSGELVKQEYDDPEPLDGTEMNWFENTIRQGIEDEQTPDAAERGLMTYFDGSDSVNEKVRSLFPSVEEVDGRLYGVAVCQVRGTLSPGEMEELKEYCRGQYSDGWGEVYAQRPWHTEEGELYVNFWQDNNFSILTKEELETARAACRPLRQPKRGGESR